MGSQSVPQRGNANSFKPNLKINIEITANFNFWTINFSYFVIALRHTVHCRIFSGSLAIFQNYKQIIKKG